MRTLLSSILVLGITAQPILAQSRINNPPLTYVNVLEKAFKAGAKICDEHHKTNIPIEMLMGKELMNIPTEVRNNEDVLSFYFEMVKLGISACKLDNKFPLKNK